MSSSFILTLKNKPEGVFSIIDRKNGDHIIPIFEEEDDAVRYAIQLEEETRTPELQIVEVDRELMVSACEEREQKYAIIAVDDFLIPPLDLI